MDAPKRSGIYCRLSYAPDGSVEKVERQEGDCREMAARMRWPISEAHVFRDNSRSAWQRNRRRPAWDAMLAAIEAGEIDAVVIYHGDRLIRQPYDLEKLIGIADSKAIRIASPSGTRNLDNPDDRFILRIEAAQACKESDNTSRRVLRGIAADVTKGVGRNGGKRPFGYGVPTGQTRTRVDAQTGETREVPILDTTQQVPEEAAILAQAAEQLLAGQTQGGVVRWMNDEAKSRTTEGNRWTSRSLQHLLLSPRVAGLIEYQGTLYPAAWKPIVSRETWEDLAAHYGRSSQIHPYQGRRRRHLLTGIAECESCDTTVRNKPSGGRNRKTSRLYHCWNPECPRKLARSQEHLDAYVKGRVLRLLNTPEFVDELHASDSQPAIGAEIAELERRKRQTREQLEELADHEDLDPTILALSLASFTRKIDALRARMATTSRRRLLLRMAGISPEEWDAEPIDVRSATVQALYRVVILPATWHGPGFDPASVRLERKPLDD